MRSGLLVALGSVVALARALARARRAGARGGRRRGRRPCSDGGRGRSADGRVSPRRLPRGARDELLEARPDEAERRRADRSSERERRRGAERRPGLRHGHEPGLRHHAAHGRGSRGLRLVCRRDRGRSPVAHARDRRQRAEPESLLAPAVRPRRVERRAGRVPGAPCADVRRDQGGVARRARLRGRGLAARHRPSGRRSPDALADDVHPGDGSRLSGERSREARDGRARRSTSTATTRASRRPSGTR